PGEAGWRALDALHDEKPARGMLWEASPTEGIRQKLEARGVGVIVFELADKVLSPDAYCSAAQYYADALFQWTQYEQCADLLLSIDQLEPLTPDDYTFSFGKGVVLREGSDMTLVASGGVVANTIRAAEQMEADGVASARVVNIHTIKPLDEELVMTCAAETGRIVTVEDHSFTGGLGSAVCEALSETPGVVVHRIGLEDYGQSGGGEELYTAYGLSAEAIASRTQAFLERSA
ncbi:MAG: hypothetical protein IH801_04795, partial [Nitrospinae bacterium]|nr:hypothetical protein [Nitrospinota bacterium]